MTDAPSACTATASASDAARVMWDCDCGVVPVVDDAGCAVGIVTDRDICMAAYFSGRPLSTIQLGDIMSRDLCTIDADADLAAAERRMQERQIRRLPVTGDNGCLIGMLSLGDVAQAVGSDGAAPASGRDGQELVRTVTKVSEPRLQA